MPFVSSKLRIADEIIIMLFFESPIVDEPSPVASQFMSIPNALLMPIIRLRVASLCANS